MRTNEARILRQRLPLEAPMATDAITVVVKRGSRRPGKWAVLEPGVGDAVGNIRLGDGQWTILGGSGTRRKEERRRKRPGHALGVAGVE